MFFIRCWEPVKEQRAIELEREEGRADHEENRRRKSEVQQQEQLSFLRCTE